MRTKIIRSISLILSILLVFLSLTSCLGDTDTVKSGITVEPGAPKTVSDAARARAAEVIGGLLSNYYSASGLAPTESEAAADCERLLGITLEIQIGDTAYLAFVELLGECGGELISSLVSPSGDTLGGLVNAYLEFSSLISAEYSGNILYGLALFAYDEK